MEYIQPRIVPITFTQLKRMIRAPSLQVKGHPSIRVYGTTLTARYFEVTFTNMPNKIYKVDSNA